MNAEELNSAKKKKKKERKKTSNVARLVDGVNSSMYSV